jgi:aspartyl protease family protein
MQNRRNPWNRDGRGNSGGRLAVAAAAAAGFGVLAYLLAGRFPGAIDSQWDWARLLQLIGLLALVSGGVFVSRRFKAQESLRNLGIWAVIALALMSLYAFQDELQTFTQRIRSELLPGEPVLAGENEIVLTAGRDGHFYAFAEVNGARVRFLIDTGASDIVLAPGDAERIGIDMGSLAYSRSYRTANGIGEGAPLRLDSLRIGPISLEDLPASVNRAPMETSLLGMSFLRQLGSFEIEGRRMRLRTR